MHARFLLGPAGSGKTFRCLAEIRAALEDSPDGPPLLLIAPKQATFQLERQLLSSPGLPGYTRLRILSFERLAEFVLDELHRPPGRLLNDEGRVMVLRALLERHRDDLKLFHSTARLPGFARQLSGLLRELQQFHLDGLKLERLADKVGSGQRLDNKLRDLALIQRAYQDWLREHDLEDADGLLAMAAKALSGGPRSKVQNPKPKAGSSGDSSPAVSGLWLDGFAEMTSQEIGLLAAVIPHCEAATLSFCLEDKPSDDLSWLSTWSVVAQTFRNCHNTVAALPGVEVSLEILKRDANASRFADNPMLRHLEEHWTNPLPFVDSIGESHPVRLIQCETPDAEAMFAAREIVRAVRDRGLRYRDIAVLLRSMDCHADLLRRTFRRYGIPFFLDRRESAAHHPLAELTRSALRTVAFHWRREDWFGALKSGFVALDDDGLDRLENEALARGWEGEQWHRPLSIPGDETRAQQFERMRRAVMPPFETLRDDVAAKQFRLNGPALATAIRELWSSLRVDETLERWNHGPVESAQIHQTVREQMNAWLENLERAFSGEAMRLTDWLPIIDAGLSNLTVGVIPPSLDQVLIGTIDRSRNPDLQLVILPAMNEGVFPAPPPHPALLTEPDRDELSRHGVELGTTRRQQIGHERYYGYIACTRARRGLLLTFAARDAGDQPLNPSPFVAHLRRMFPQLEIEPAEQADAATVFEHVSEFTAPLLRTDAAVAREALTTLELPEEFKCLRGYGDARNLAPGLADQLYGPTLHTSVSKIERFAACPFQFFVSAGLRAEERERFEVDARHLGSFQHEVLQRFHEQLVGENLRWRDITPDEAEQRVAAIAAELVSQYGNGLFGASARNRFQAGALTRSLRRFIRSVIQWMASYRFDPVKVELSFGRKNPSLPAWELDLGDGHTLVFGGIIDRVDLAVDRDADSARCVVVDYKSSFRKIDPLLLEHGIQIQLPAYLAALRRLPDIQRELGVKTLIPAGVFYVNLRGSFSRAKSRLDAAPAAESAGGDPAYQHEGRFDLEALSQLDSHGASGGTKSGQFNYRLTTKGEPYKNSPSIMRTEEFASLLDLVEEHLRGMGAAIYRGDIRIDPYLKSGKTPCEWCDFASVCRIDPWLHRYRVLRAGTQAEVVTGSAD